MKSVRKMFVFLSVLASLLLGSSVSAPPISWRVLELPDGRIEIYIGDYHVASESGDEDIARDDLCWVVNRFGKQHTCCNVEDILEKRRLNKFDTWIMASRVNGQKIQDLFLLGLHAYLKSEGIESYNAECRFGNRFSVRDALDGAKKALADTKSYNDKEWNDYYARARARVGANIDAWQDKIASNPSLLNANYYDVAKLYGSDGAGAERLRTLYSDRYADDYGALSTDLVDVRSIHAGQQAYLAG